MRLFITLLALTLAQSGQEPTQKKRALLQPSSTQWLDTSSRGLQIAFTSGDSRCQEPFTFRLRASEPTQLDIPGQITEHRLKSLTGSARLQKKEAAEVKIVRKSGSALLPDKQYTLVLQKNAVVEISGTGPFDADWLNKTERSPANCSFESLSDRSKAKRDHDKP